MQIFSEKTAGVMIEAFIAALVVTIPVGNFFLKWTKPIWTSKKASITENAERQEKFKKQLGRKKKVKNENDINELV